MDEDAREIEHTFILTFNKPLSRLVSKLIPSMKGRRTPKKMHPLRGAREVYVHSPLSPGAINIIEALEGVLGPHDEYLAYEVTRDHKSKTPLSPVLARLRINGQIKLVRGNDIPESYRT
jgi:hypothetical protein